MVAHARDEIDAVTAADRALEGRPFRTLIAEELLDGTLVTFEGWMQGGRMTAIGVTDAVMHPNGISFLRFEYPSRLPDGPRQAMADVAARLMPALGFDNSMFNIEFFVRPDGSLTIVEVNGRMASQFAPLVHAVHGISSYEIQLDLCTGRTPHLPPARDDLVTASFLLRTYEDAIVRSVPDPTHRARALPPRPRRGAGAARPPPERERRRHRQPPPGRGGAGRTRPHLAAGPVRRGGAAAPVRARAALAPPSVNNWGLAPFDSDACAWGGGPARSRPRRRGRRP